MAGEAQLGDSTCTGELALQSVGLALQPGQHGAAGNKGRAGGHCTGLDACWTLRKGTDIKAEGLGSLSSSPSQLLPQTHDSWS